MAPGEFLCNEGTLDCKDSVQPSSHPSSQLSGHLSGQLRGHSSVRLSVQPSVQPNVQLSGQLDVQPSGQLTVQLNVQLSGLLNIQQSVQPNVQPSGQPSGQPKQQSRRERLTLWLPRAPNGALNSLHAKCRKTCTRYYVSLREVQENMHPALKSVVITVRCRSRPISTLATTLYGIVKFS